MKESIISKAGRIFLKFGYKSVTMDDIANKLGISKKTIYKYFKNKAHLVDETTFYMHEIMHKEALKVYDMDFNAIKENFEVSKVFKGFMQNMDDSPIYQLQKYYPETYQKLMSQEYCLFKDCVLGNIQKGIDQGLYRKEINIERVTRFYFSLVMSLYNSDLYEFNKNTLHSLELNVLEYHTRAISTEKGITILKEQLKANKIL